MTVFLNIFLLLFIVSAGITGCTSSSDEAAKLAVKQELTKKADNPENELVEVAKRQYAAGLYDIARGTFESLRDSYPYGAYATFAELKIADCYFYNRDFESASAEYEQYAKLHPSDSGAPYALLQAVSSNLQQYTGVGRDITPLYKAKQLGEQLTLSYGESQYAKNATAALTTVEEAIAAHHALVADYYKRRNNDAAYQARLKDMPNIEGAPFEKFNLQAKLKEKESVIHSAGTRAIPVVAPPRTMRERTLPTSNEPDLIDIRSIVCSNTGQITVRLASDTPLGLSTASYQPANGKVVIPLKVKTIDHTKKSCGDFDLELTKDGTLTIAGAPTMVAMEVSSPTRIIIFPLSP